MSGVAFYIFGKPIYWYGIIIALGVMIGIYLAMRYAKALGYDQEMIIDFCLLAIPMGIVGARLYYVIFSWEYYSKNLIDAFKIWEGGLAIYGVVIGGLISAYIFARRRKIDFWDLCDIVAPSLILGQALGRWGNFFNQEAYGYPITNPAWQWFPAAVFINDTGQWHMATFFYESMWNFMVFFFLLFYKRKRKNPGEMILLYLILYSLGRFFIEGLRTDSLYWGQFRVSQVLSGLLIISGIVMFVIRRKKALSSEKENLKEEG
ncbi:MAG: prolipoprotein diacylglyceryl transferase [Caldicoprobacterales bacterium]|jgi:phosphatidylglycerol:prolipoprotein diacylglycerol transferase|nr:prolipoprotein diacylglyceryl transferase [Clostridiales bacterium]